MRPFSRILFGVLLALCWSGLAAADPHSPGQPSESSVFRTATDIRLDNAFEKFVSQASRQVLYGMAGPSSMNCTNAAGHGGIETCVVTTQSHTTSMPAALAQH